MNIKVVPKNKSKNLKLERLTVMVMHIKNIDKNKKREST